VVPTRGASPIARPSALRRCHQRALGSAGSAAPIKGQVCHHHQIRRFHRPPNMGTRHLAFVGAAITVLLLLFDPFLQQVVVYPDRLVASEKAAFIARAQRYQARSDEGLPLPSIVDMSMKVSTWKGSCVIDVNTHDFQGRYLQRHLRCPRPCRCTS